MWQIYDGQELYDVQGQPITEEGIHNLFPASVAEQVVVKTAGNILLEIKTFLEICSLYGVNYRDKDAIDQVNYKVSLEQTKNSPLERIAASLEYLVLLSMEDKNK